MQIYLFLLTFDAQDMYPVIKSVLETMFEFHLEEDNELQVEDNERTKNFKRMLIFVRTNLDKQSTVYKLL